MAPEKTGVDAILVTNTGASTHNAVQANPALSLGNHSSSSPLVSVKAVATVHAMGSGELTVQRIEANNPIGTGVLAAPTTGSVTWAAPGGTAGPAVAIANGETKQLLDGTDANNTLIVKRTNASDLTSTSNVVIVQEDVNAFFSDVADAERVAGSQKHRCHAIENVSGASISLVDVRLKTLGTKRTTNVTQLPASGSGTIESSAGNFADWPQQGYGVIKNASGTLQEWVYYESRDNDKLTVAASGRGLGETSETDGAANDTIDAVGGFELSIEAPASQDAGAFNTVADEDAAPAGATWLLPITDAEALTIGTLAAGQIYAIRLRRVIAPGSTNVLDESMPYTIQFQAV